jgi:hypothetical protein
MRVNRVGSIFFMELLLRDGYGEDAWRAMRSLIFHFFQCTRFARGDQGERKPEFLFFYPPSCAKKRIFLERTSREEDV